MILNPLLPKGGGASGTASIFHERHFFAYGAYAPCIYVGLFLDIGVASIKNCFLFTPMQNDSLIRPIEKWFLGSKKGRFDPLGKSTPKEHTHHQKMDQ